MRFTNYYSAQAVSSTSRAGLLTGCYPNRIEFAGALGPKSKTGLNPDEETMAENLKKAGYATAIVGKWHVGCRPGLMPLDHGFDEYFGLPYSNDMWPHHPQTSSYPPLPLYEGRKVVNPSVSAADQAQLTTRYTEHAVDFITRRSEGPFFLYLAHSMPHVPLFVSDKFKGKSEQGLYDDVMMEIDWSVGEVLKALEKNGAASNTIVVLTSDNGPWINYGDHAGSTGGLREGKGTTFEGGQRVPCIVWWPGTTPAGTICNQLASSIDLLPTFAEIAGTPLPAKQIDGVSIRSLFEGVPGRRATHVVPVLLPEKQPGSRARRTLQTRVRPSGPQLRSIPARQRRTPGQGGRRARIPAGALRHAPRPRRTLRRSEPASRSGRGADADRRCGARGPGRRPAGNARQEQASGRQGRINDEGQVRTDLPLAFAARKTDYLRSFPISAKADFTSCSFC